VGTALCGPNVAASPQVIKRSGDTPHPAGRYRNAYATVEVDVEPSSRKSTRCGHLPLANGRWEEAEDNEMQRSRGGRMWSVS